MTRQERIEAKVEAARAVTPDRPTPATVRAFDQGFQLGADVEARIARKALAQAALAILGKDAGDGWVSLGALGTWGITAQHGEVVERREVVDGQWVSVTS